MKLTNKDAEFLARLRSLLEERALSIEFCERDLKRFILRNNYGDRIHKEFAMTRQGVRWRFQRVFGEMYPRAYESILFIESHFGAQLRRDAMAIARQRAELRKAAMKEARVGIWK